MQVAAALRARDKRASGLAMGRHHVCLCVAGELRKPHLLGRLAAVFTHDGAARHRYQRRVGRRHWRQLQRRSPSDGCTQCVG